MRWTKIAVVIAVATLISVLLFRSALQKSQSVERDISTLLNFYYSNQDKNPLKAKEALDLILAQDPTNSTAMHAKINWFTERGDTHSALIFLEQNYKNYPNNYDIGFELAKIYVLLNQYAAAKPLLASVIASGTKKERGEAVILYQALYPEEPVKKTNENLLSYIAPVHFDEKKDWSSLYEKVQQVMKLQPESARNFLKLLISIDPTAWEAYVKLGYLELEQNQNDNALQSFLKAFSIKPEAILAVQIAYLFDKKYDKEQAIFFFNYCLGHGNDALKQQCKKALGYLEQSPLISGVAQKLSPEQVLWNTFYTNKTKNPALALRTINRLLSAHPKDIKILKEAAYFAMAQKDTSRAIGLWKQAYNIEHNPEYALNIGYLYDTENNKSKAFNYFDLASNTKDMKIKDKAETALTNLAGAQFKFLPDPYFAELYITPLYLSRFDIGILPSIIRLGKTIEKKHSTDVYLTYRRTSDNRSGTLRNLIIQSSISQIFDDNVAIYGVGIRRYLFPTVPLLVFFEAGRAEDLVYRFRPKWRDDLRGGLVYFNGWGAKPSYSNKLDFSFKWVCTLYSDLIYYSRYNNVISTNWFRPGFRVATFQSASLDLYMANYLILDTQHEFYNNIYLVGPGIMFQPSNRVNIRLRMEALQGYYLNVNSPTPNPYSSKYWSNLVMIEAFFRF